MKVSIKHSRSILLAAAGMALGALPLHAATVAAPLSNDIFVGIRASGGQGASTAYIINIGQYSALASTTAGTTTTLSLGNLSSDLERIYGAGWASRNDLLWGVVGRNNSGTLVYASSAGGAYSPITDPGELNGISNNISSLINNSVVGYTDHEASPGSSRAIEQVGVTGAASYITQVSTPGALDFGGWADIETTVGGDGVLNLYRINTSSATTPGYLSLGNDGSISFTAVPEPSSALLALAGSAALLVYRRRSLPVNA